VATGESTVGDLPIGFEAASILCGADAIIDRHLGCLDVGSSSPHYLHKSTCLRLSETPLLKFNACTLIREIVSTVQLNWLQSDRRTRPSSPAIWRFEPRLHIADNNRSAEKLLEKAIAKLLPNWVNQVPTASGLASSRRDRHRNIDLVHRISPDEFEFVELKIESDTPLVAAMELLQYFVLFLFVRQTFPSLIVKRIVFNARQLHLCVLAPQRFYREYQLQWFEQECTRGVSEVAADHAIEADFAFHAFPDDFAEPCPEELLEDAIERRCRPKWGGEGPSRLATRDFPEVMRIHQQQWARLAQTIGPDRLDRGHGTTTWVLKREHVAANFFDPRWLKFLAGFEHRWLRSLISSQCLAVNLFAPLAEDSKRANVVLGKLLPDRNLLPDDHVSLRFEQTPAAAARWLGESGQPTQVDVLFTVRRGDRSIGYALVEVKFTEVSFGGCRGWQGSKGGEPQNPDRNRCLDLTSIIQNPTNRCWMVEHEGRRYWEIINRDESSIRPQQLPAGSACPFRYGLYQIMRNRLLADCMRRERGADWADVAICVHPGNKMVRQQTEQVSGKMDIVEQFHTITGSYGLRDWDINMLLDTAVAAGASMKWADWMRSRYIF
jgi:hypothetical protein